MAPGHTPKEKRKRKKGKKRGVNNGKRKLSIKKQD